MKFVQKIRVLPVDKNFIQFLRNCLRSSFSEVDMQHFQKPLTQLYKDIHRTNSLKSENATEIATKVRDREQFLKKAKIFSVSKARQKIRASSSFFGLIVVFLLIFSKISQASDGKNLTIFCEPSISRPMAELVRNFSRKNNVVITVKFNTPNELTKKIDEEDLSDIFISADLDAIDFLRQKGLIDVYNIAFIASDHLALATSKANKDLPPAFEQGNLKLESAIKILSQRNAKLLIDRNGYSSSRFAENFLNEIAEKNLSVLKKLQSDPQSLIDDLSKSDKTYGMAFHSQFTKHPELKLIKTKENPVVSYQAMAIAGDNMETAREFLNFLKSDSGKKILRDSELLVN